MATSSPIKTIDKEGKVGRPATVKRTALRLISETILIQLDTACVIPCAVPKKTVKSVCKIISKGILDDLNKNDLYLVPGKTVDELSLLVGRNTTILYNENKNL